MDEKPIGEEMFSIGAVSKLTGAPIKTIRYYAEIGLLPPADTTQTRYRRYTSVEVQRLELIRTLRQMDFSIPEIRRMLADEVSVAATVRLHLDALALHVRQLERLRELLARVSDELPHEDAPLDYLHAVGEVLRQSDAERRDFFARAIQATLVDASAPEPWRRNLIAGFLDQLPSERTSEQELALAEVKRLSGDAELVEASQEEIAGFWTMARAGAVDQVTWSERMAAIHQRITDALARGEPPDSDAVQAIALDWAALFAAAAQTQLDDAFIRTITERAATWGAGRTRPLMEALMRLTSTETQRTLPQAQRLVLDALRWRVAHGDERARPCR